MIEWRFNLPFCAFETATLDDTPTRDGRLNSEDLVAFQKADAAYGGRKFEERLFYCDDGELFYCDGTTDAFTNKCGHRCIEAIDQLIERFSEEPLSYRASE